MLDQDNFLISSKRYEVRWLPHSTWTSRIVGSLVRGEPFAETHVRKLGVHVLCEEHVVRLQVPVNNAAFMQGQQAFPHLLADLERQQQGVTSVRKAFSLNDRTTDLYAFL